MALGKKYSWLAKIIFGAYFLTVELVKSNRGIFPPGNVKAIGYDLLALFLYGGGLYLLYAGVRDFKAQKKPPS
jgi:hypothetical protein